MKYNGKLICNLKNKRQIRGRWLTTATKKKQQQTAISISQYNRSSEASLGFCRNCLKTSKTAGETGDYCIFPTIPTQGKWKESIKYDMCNL